MEQSPVHGGCLRSFDTKNIFKLFLGLIGSMTYTYMYLRRWHYLSTLYTPWHDYLRIDFILYVTDKPHQSQGMVTLSPSSFLRMYLHKKVLLIFTQFTHQGHLQFFLFHEPRQLNNIFFNYSLIISHWNTKNFVINISFSIKNQFMFSFAFFPILWPKFWLDFCLTWRTIILTSFLLSLCLS